MLYFLTGDIQTGKTRWLQSLIGSIEAAGAIPYGVVAPGIWEEHVAEDGSVSFAKLGITNELLPSHEAVLFALRRDLAESEHAARTESGGHAPVESAARTDVAHGESGGHAPIESAARTDAAYGKNGFPASAERPPADLESGGTCSQADRARLGWAIRDEAIAQVNRHLEAVVRRTADNAKPASGNASGSVSGKACDGTSGGTSGKACDNAPGEKPSRVSDEAVGTPPDDAADAASHGLLIIDELGRLELLAGEGLTAAMALLDRGATTALPHALVVVRDTLLDIAKQRFTDAPWNGMRAIHPDDGAFREIHNALNESPSGRVRS